MRLDDNDYWQRWTARLLAILAADASDQLAWAGEHQVQMDVRGRAGRWADALTADATWGEVRTLARRILVARLGEWQLPLPRRVPPQHIYD
jgi:hypothetical protein